MSETKGFTILEVLVVMVIFTILTKTALNGFPELRRSFNRNAARQQLEFDLQRARSEALANGVRTILSVNSGGRSYTVGMDEYPFSSLSAADSTLFVNELPGEIQISAAAPIIFNSSGYVIDQDGALSDTSVSLVDDGGVILNGIVYAIGSLEYE